MITTIILLLLGQSPFKEQVVVPDTKIEAPANVNRGKNIILSVVPTDRPKNLMDYNFTWIVCPKAEDIFSWPDQSKIAFGSGLPGDPTDYTITLVASYQLKQEENGDPILKTVVVSTTVHVVDTKPPKPPDDPDPPPPPPSSTFSDQIYGIFKALPLAERKSVAGNFRTVSNSIKAGSFKSRSDMLVRLADLNTATLGPSLKAWSKSLDEMAAVVNTKKPTLSDCILLWEDVAKGLEREP